MKYIIGSVKIIYAMTMITPFFVLALWDAIFGRFYSDNTLTLAELGDLLSPSDWRGMLRNHVEIVFLGRYVYEAPDQPVPVPASFYPHSKYLYVVTNIDDAMEQKLRHGGLVYRLRFK